jgi:hypothetical protein
MLAVVAATTGARPGAAAAGTPVSRGPVGCGGLCHAVESSQRWRLQEQPGGVTSGISGLMASKMSRVCRFTCRAGTLMVREGSHAQHEQFWGQASGMSDADKAANGDFYLFKPEVFYAVHTTACPACLQA